MSDFWLGKIRRAGAWMSGVAVCFLGFHSISIAVPGEQTGWLAHLGGALIGIGFMMLVRGVED
jgi:membrane associated rhomboid family serine protease